MMNEPEIAPDAPNSPNPLRLRRLQSMLGQITQLAKESSLTGCFQSANSSVIEQYNRILSAIEQQGVELHGLFAPLGAEASFDEVGVTAAQLFAFLEDDVRAAIPMPPTPSVPPAPPIPPMPFPADFDLNNLENLKRLGAAISFGQHAGSLFGQHMRSHWMTKDEENLDGKPKETVQVEVSTSRETRRPSDDGEEAAQREEIEGEKRMGQQFTDADFSDAIFRDVNLSRVEFSDVDLSAVSFRDVNMNGAQFHDVSFSGAAFSDVEMSGAAVRDANMSGGRFEDVNFSSVAFRDVNLAGCQFEDANFSGANFHDVNFTQTVFRDVNFNGVALLDCEISGLTINGIAVEQLLRNYRGE